MTRDEIFSNELEYLYFRLVAARNALNEAKDPDTESCLWDILTQTLDKIDRKGTEEDRAAAGAIVVRKSNKYARYILTNQKIVLIAKIVTALIAIGTVCGILLVLTGSESKVTPTIVIAAVGAVLITLLVIVIKFKTMKMDVALEHLKGKTVIGARINTSGTKSTSESQSFSVKDKHSQPKVVYNFKGIIVAAIIIAVVGIAALGIVKYGSDLVVGGKNLLAKVGLYVEKTDIDIETYQKLNDKLQNAHDSLCYDEALRCINASKYDKAEELLSMIPLHSNYKDTEKKLKEVRSYSSYEQGVAAASKSIVEASNLLFDVPDDFLDAGELKQKYNTLKSFCAGYKNGVDKVVIKDFYIDGDKLFITIDGVGSFEITKYTSDNVISYKGTPDSKKPETWWQLKGDELILHSAGSQITYKK